MRLPDWWPFPFVIVVSAAVLVWACVTGSANVAAREQARLRWVADAQQKACKRTGYAGKHPQPIWACTDGQVYLEPYQ